jgi:hypothetical protein
MSEVALVFVRVLHIGIAMLQIYGLIDQLFILTECTLLFLPLQNNLQNLLYPKSR